MKKFVFSFVVTLVLVATTGQAWADGTPIPPNPPNPKFVASLKPPVLADGTPLPPSAPNPK